MPTLLPGLVLGFPTVHGGACGRGKPGALQEGPMAPAGVTASVPAKPTGISPVRHTSTSPAAPSHSTNLAAHQHAPPRSLDHHRRLTMEREARPTDLRGDNREQGAAKNSSHTGGTTSTALGGHRPDATIGAHQAHGPAEPKRTREAPVTTLQLARHRLRNPPHEPHLRPSKPSHTTKRRSETDEAERRQPGMMSGKIGSHTGGDDLHGPWRSPAGRSKKSTPGPRPGRARQGS